MVEKMDKPSDIIWESGWEVTTLAGSDHAGYRDGRSAQFSHPESVTVDSRGDVYVADFKNNRLRKVVVPDGTSYTVAGTGEYGSKDGAARESQFKYPLCMTTTQSGDIILAESNRIRAYSPKENTVRTIAAGADAGVTYPSGLAMSADNFVLVSNTNNHRIIKVHASNNGSVETVAGLGYAGYADGEWRKARFHKPWGIAVSPEGDIYVADSKNHRIRKIDGHTRSVSTVAGSGKQGWRDGDALESRLNRPRGVAIAMDGCLYIADSGNHCIRKLDVVDRRIVTIAGDGTEGALNGDGTKAQFRWPRGLAFGPDGVLYLADRGNHCVRAISKQAESALAAVEEEFEQVVEHRDKLLKEIECDATSTLAAQDALVETRDTMQQVQEELEAAQQKLREKRLILHNFVAQRKTEVRDVKKEVLALKAAKEQRAQALALAQAELAKARAALDHVSSLGTKCTKELSSVDEQLRRAGWRAPLEDEKKPDGTQEVADAQNVHGNGECKDETIKEESTMDVKVDKGSPCDVENENTERKRRRSEGDSSREEESTKRHQSARSEDGADHIDDSWLRKKEPVDVQVDAAQQGTRDFLQDVDECMGEHTQAQVDTTQKNDLPAPTDVDECMGEHTQVQVDMTQQDDARVPTDVDESIAKEARAQENLVEKNLEESPGKEPEVQTHLADTDTATLPKHVEECMDEQSEVPENHADRDILSERQDVEQATHDHVVKDVDGAEKKGADMMIDEECVERQIELAEKENMKLLQDLEVIR